MNEEKKYLKSLTSATALALNLMDKEMKEPSDENRGKMVAKILNDLEFTNDAAMHFGLGYSFKKIERLKK